MPTIARLRDQRPAAVALDRPRNPAMEVGQIWLWEDAILPILRPILLQARERDRQPAKVSVVGNRPND